MRHRSAAGVTALAALLLPLVAAPAAASAALPFKPAAHPVSAQARKVGGTYNINGYNWGGYAATGGTGAFTSISATWVEPTAKCNSRNDLYAPWVGLDGYGSSTVEQTGVATDCSSGSPVDEPWYEMYPASPVYLNTGTYPVKSGDTMKASVTYASSKFTLVLSDSTKGWTYTIAKALSSAKRSSAEAIIESPTAGYPNFGTLTFSSVTVNGSPIGNYSPVAMDPSSGSTYEAHASALTGGNKFTMTYEHE